MNLNKLKKLSGDASIRSFYRKKNYKNSSILVYCKKQKESNLLIYGAINNLLIKQNILAPRLINHKSKTDEKINLDKYNKVKKTITDYQKFIKDNLKYVGDNFAYEARSIHYNGKKKTKGIYGNASKEDLKELKEEGIDAQMTLG